LINNAGAGRWLPITLTCGEEAASMIGVPYLAAFNLTRELLGGMLKRSKGHIVNVTSVASRLAWPKAVAYIAARRAMEGFNAALRADLYGSGIGVTLAVFGTVDSPYWDHNPGSREYLPKRAASIRALTPGAAGEAIVTAIERNRSIIIKPAIFRLFFLLNELFPTQTEAIMCS
jgi:short-subunit dehydrogenase